MKPLLLSALLALAFVGHAQLPKPWIGQWNGTMLMYKNGQKNDSVAVSLTIAPLIKDSIYTWKTQYHSTKMPMTKDYTLRVKDAAKGVFVTDEGGGVELTNYLIDNKMYNVFEVQNTMLTATYELRGNELIFEVTSGKKELSKSSEVINYSTNFLQKVRFKKYSKSK